MCVCVTDVVCSRGQSILECTCILHHKHCSRLRYDSYMCGYNWVPTDQEDTLQHRDNKMLVLVLYSCFTSVLCSTQRFMCSFMSLCTYFMVLLSELTLGTVAANPSWITLAGAIDGVTGAIVGAAAAPGTVLPKATTGTHCTHDTRVSSAFMLCNHNLSRKSSHFLSITSNAEYLDCLVGSL